MLGRELYYGNSDRIIKLCVERKIQGPMAAHSISNMFYILRKDMPVETRREVLLNLCDILTIEAIDPNYMDLMKAILFNIRRGENIGSKKIKKSRNEVILCQHYKWNLWKL